MKNNIFEIESIPLRIPKSTKSTQGNQTGTWRFVRPVMQRKTAPCSNICPAGEDIPQIEQFVNQGQFQRAWETIILENPFPAICGRVCFHTCEQACNRLEYDSPVTIHRIERFIGDWAIQNKLTPFTPFYPNTGKHVAIIGAGPAGLSAAYFLSLLGYRATIFEQKSEPGGLLRWGIPAYRLPTSVLFNEIHRMISPNIKVECNHRVPSSFIHDAPHQFDSVIVACGQTQSLSSDISGDYPIKKALPILESIRNNDKLSIQGKVGIIGGGNTAIDIARSLIRLGATPIIFYRRRKEDMPAFIHEIQMAINEGVEIIELCLPTHIDKAPQGMMVTCQKMALNGLKNNRMSVIPDTTQPPLTMHLSDIVSAIGTAPDPTWISKQDIIAITQLSHCSLSLYKHMPVIMGGDLINKTLSVTDAIASGKQAAIVLDSFFKQGKEAIPIQLESCRIGNGTAISFEMYIGKNRKNQSRQLVAKSDINFDYFSQSDPSEPLEKPITECTQTFNEIEQSLTKQDIQHDVARCIQCGICNDCDHCRLFCPELAVNMEGGKRQINYNYCKGCGICVTECPRHVLHLEEEA